MENPIYNVAIPAPLTFYRGGLNVGVFYAGPPASPFGSTVLGNEFVGKAREYRARGEGNGVTNFGWILILAPEDIKFSIRSLNDEVEVKNTSVYDGYYNKNRSTSNEYARLSRYSPNSYRDWYIPSREELAFIAKNLPKNFYLPMRFSPMTGRYLSSTFYSQKVGTSSKKFSLLLSQSFDSPTYGDTILVSDTKEMAVRLVRRVPVYIN